MIASILLAGSLFGTAVATAADPPPDAPRLQAYEEAKSRAGHDADAQVKLALWCEAHGLTAERIKHLTLATLSDPSHVAARGLLGLISYQGKWQRPDEVSRQAKEDPARQALLKEYLDRRARAANKPDDQWNLALWCEKNGLAAQARAHLQQVIGLEPRRDAAWKRLGYKKQSGRWVKPELVAAHKTELEAQTRANRCWKPKLEKWRESLSGRDKTRKAAAEEALAQIADPRAVPMVWAIFARGSLPQQRVALTTLSQIDSPAASRFLALLAVFSGYPEIRGSAIATLRRRDSREFADLLISMIQEPIAFEVKPVGGPGSPGELFIKGRGSKANLKRLYAPPPGPDVPLQPGDRVVYDDAGMPVIQRPTSVLGQSAAISPLYMIGLGWRNPAISKEQEQNVMGLLLHSGLGAKAQQIGQQLISAYQNQSYMGPTPFYQFAMEQGIFNDPTSFNLSGHFSFTIAEGIQIPIGRMELDAQKSATAAGEQLQRDVNDLRTYNNSLRELNDRVVPVLKDVSGLDLGTNQLEWQKWFTDLIGYQALSARPAEPPTIIEQVPLDYQPQPVPIGSFVGPIGVRRISCFGAGTLVRTLTALKPIEELTLGDQVLTQNTRTGALAYRPILVTHHNPPSKTYRVALNDETIVSSYFHRFWKAGQGWVMARDLKVGDSIRTLNGTVKVTAIGDGQVIPVYNLDVAEDADFFVGQTAALVHDNTLPDLRQPPFDAVDGSMTVEPGKTTDSPRRSPGSAPQ